MTVVSCLSARKAVKQYNQIEKLGGLTTLEEMVSLLSDRLNLR